MTENYILETERLKIYPLTPEQLRGWIYDVGALEKTLGICSFCNIQNEVINRRQELIYINCIRIDGP